ncbi:hypothetical protein EJ02DRAFT_515230 [Clathrospora elynae]|uniref:Uncharacterized protein n=1 Tax=Clathrospora elynae TaxID=706981 RepID=A0A6A5SCI7_9PLEO|nr:hypothetical protein EJ02DRAFT_515230 [Clathrospora elynae]
MPTRTTIGNASGTPTSTHFDSNVERDTFPDAPPAPPQLSLSPQPPLTPHHTSLGALGMQLTTDRSANHAAPLCHLSAHRLTSHALDIHEKTFDHLLHAAQKIIKAIDIQQAAKDIGIGLPVHCYMGDRSQLNEWIKQQSD